MITAIDFGTSTIRSAFRSPSQKDRLTIFAERAEYALIPATQTHRQLLIDQSISFAECDNSIAVIGNQINRIKWLSRVPSTALMADGVVPVDDPPARQMLSVLVNAMLPVPEGNRNLCAITIPGMAERSDQAQKNAEFLMRLVEMRGYEAIPVGSAQALMLTSGKDSAFTGIGIVMGAESIDVCVSRYGIPLATSSLAVGSNWIDTEIAKEFRIHAWDEQGQCYLDLEAVRSWKQTSMLNIHHPMGDREQSFARLYTVVMDRITRTVAQLIKHTAVANELGKQRLAVLLAGGPVRLAGFASLLTERMIEHGLADRLLSVRLASDPELSIVRGALVFAELESQHRSGFEYAA